MRIDEQNRVLIAVAEVVPMVWKINTYKSAQHRGTIKTTVRGGRGRFVEIIYDTLPERYKSKIVSAIGDPRVLLGLIPVTDTPRKWRTVPFNELTAEELSVCTAKYNIVKSFRQYADQNGQDMGITAAKNEFVALLNEGLVCQNSASAVGKVSYPTIERWNKDLRDGGDIMDVLAPARAERTGRQLTPDQTALLIDCYCKDSMPKYSQAYRTACKIFKIRNYGDEMVSEVTAQRFLREWERKNSAIARVRREGMKAAKDTQMPYIERNPDDIQFMDCWYADGKVLNFQVIHPITGRPCRPTMIAWLDAKTNRIMGFEIMVTENTLSVLSALRNACLNTGYLLGTNGAILPRVLYMDNGRAFNNIMLNGKKPAKQRLIDLFSQGINLEEQTSGLFARLKQYGLEHVLYAKPYNARTKTIERAWQGLDEFEQLVCTYIGNSIANKPASLQRNEIVHRLYREKAIEKNGIPTVYGAYLIMQYAIDQYNDTVSEGKYLNGATPNAAALEQAVQIDFTGRAIPVEKMDYMLMHSKTLKLGRNGFRINNISYYNTKFANIEKKGVDTEYIVKYSLLDRDRVLVFEENGEFLCEARKFFGSDIHPVSVLGSDADRKKCKLANTKLSSMEKALKKAAFGHTTNSSLMLSDIFEACETAADILPPTGQCQLPAAPIEETTPVVALWSQD
ncbi:MAG: Mu transposase C-terminal domain-containing protein [Bacteroidales bacterium]